MKENSRMTSEEYIALVKRAMPHFHRVACAETEEEFCEAVGMALRHCLQKLEDRRKLLADAGEFALSTDLADLLSCGGLPTKAEPYVNGHVDLVISDFEAGRYRMLGECKLHSGPKYHCDGTRQVLGYCSGAEKRTICLDFCKHPDIQGRMTMIRQHMEKASPCHSLERTVNHDLPWSFIGMHRHSSGTTVEVLHIGCNLHDPGKVGASASSSE
jgi:hypothetical protein